MRIVANFFMSLDGVVEAPHEWQSPFMNDEVGRAIGVGFATSDALLMGRVTYEEWFAVWPHRADDPMADAINGARKYVVSDKLDSVAWEGSTLISGDVEDQIRALKEQPGRDLTMSGSGTLATWLLERDLLDALHLLVHPLVLGHGRRLFGPGLRSTTLALTSSEQFSNGVVHLTYGPAAAMASVPFPETAAAI